MKASQPKGDSTNMNEHHAQLVGMYTKKPRRLHIAVALLLTVLILANMVLIFCFSAESAQDSGKRSEGVTVLVARLISPEYDDMTPAEQDATVESIHRLVRKTAHFLEYALLGFLTAGLLGYLRRYFFPKLQGWHTWALPAGFCLLYAASDEIHQIFSGRGPRVTDVFIDFAGAVFGVACLHLFVWLIGRICAAVKHRKEGRRLYENHPLPIDVPQAGCFLQGGYCSRPPRPSV